MNQFVVRYPFLYERNLLTTRLRKIKLRSFGKRMSIHFFFPGQKRCLCNFAQDPTLSVYREQVHRWKKVKR